MLTDAEAKTYLAFAGDLADAARVAIMPHFRAETTIEAKPGRAFDPVTAADKAAETAMRAMIEARFPEHGIVGEEFPAKAAAGKLSWVLDPIDGTRAFISGLPLWGVLIALVHEDDGPVIGIIDQPYLEERFRGYPGGADFISRAGVRPLKVRPCTALREATMATTDPNLFTGAEAGGVELVRSAAKLTRYGCDCYAYAMIALGHIDLVIESGLKAWDVCALMPVIEGAGGVVTDWRGKRVWTGGQVLAVGDMRTQEEALMVLRRVAHTRSP
jgi:myo-inositol-1(or 4)-monophosphatase